MEPDTLGGDAVERAHLRRPGDTSHTMSRYPPPADLAGLVQRFWVPVWSVPPGEESPQQVLQHPCCLVVVAPDYARFVGVVRGLSTTTLRGDGWAVGVMLTPGAGFLVAGGDVTAVTDGHVDLADVLPGADELAGRVRAAMAADPSSPAAHAAAMDLVAGALRRYLPPDAEAALVDRVVAFVESRPDVLRVSQVCDAFGLSERTLQRLVRRRLGLHPKWLVQRRRLHEAASRLRAGSTTLAAVATDLGYADQPHLVRDFSRVVGVTPGEFAARYPG